MYFPNKLRVTVDMFQDLYSYYAIELFAGQARFSHVIILDRSNIASPLVELGNNIDIDPEV
jgi:hypothetical protein